MPMLADKVIAVTGAGRGIGRAIALLCAREGARVVVNDFGSSVTGEGSDAEPANSVVSEIRAAGGAALANLADVTDPAGAESIIADAIGGFGTIDAVVNNAGFVRDAMFHKMSVRDWRQVVDVHLNASFYVSRAAANHFREQESGVYVHLTSGAGLFGSIGQANYAAAKLGVVGLSTSIALDMQRFSVRSNCIAPWAWTRTMETMPADTPERRQWLGQLKQMAPDEIAPLVAYLCSDQALDVSGQVFGVRKNDIFLIGRAQLLGAAHRDEGWTPQLIAETLMPTLRPNFQPLRRSSEIFASRDA